MAARRRKKRGGRWQIVLLAVLVLAAGAVWYVKYYKKAVPARTVVRQGVGYKAQDRIKLDKLIEQGDLKK